MFFAKLVSYTFLYWLPTFIKETGKYKLGFEGKFRKYSSGNTTGQILIDLLGDGVSSEDAAYFSTWFDIGGLLGGIIAGLATDITGMSASVCSVMLIGAIPLVMK